MAIDSANINLPNCWIALSALQGSSRVMWTRLRWFWNKQVNSLDRSQSTTCLLLTDFVFHTETGKKCEGMVTKRKGTMGRRKITGEAQSRPFYPSRLPLRANLHHEKDVWVRGSSTLILNKFSWKNRWKLRIFNVASSQLTNLSFPLFPRPYPLSFPVLNSPFFSNG